MSIVILLFSLGLLMLAAYRGFSVILFAPIAALSAVVLYDPHLVPPYMSGVFMEKLAGFVKLYLPVFLLGAAFGKLIEISGFARSIIKAVTRLVGPSQAMLAVVLVCAILTYGGVSLFVVAFAVYPFAAELFRTANIPKRLIPGTVALGAFTFTMDALPGSPQIQNIIPGPFFGTDTWAAPRLGIFGAVFVLGLGLSYLEWRRRQAARAGEGYGEDHKNEPEMASTATLPHPALAVLPLLLVGVLNRAFGILISANYGKTYNLAAAGIPKGETLDVAKVASVWAVEGALVVAIGAILVLAWPRVREQLSTGMHAAVGGALLASLNTASEYGFGAVIAALPGFKLVTGALNGAVAHPLVNEAVTTTTLAGITGSASGGMSIALAAMSKTYLESAAALGIPAEVLHRVAAMASGGMDTLPHNGAVITLLAITGLTHRQAYGDIFAMTLIKTAAVFAVIGLHSATGVC
jgi:H+/gluconate symporter-like permease